MIHLSDGQNSFSRVSGVCFVSSLLCIWIDICHHGWAVFSVNWKVFVNPKESDPFSSLKRVNELVRVASAIILRLNEISQELERYTVDDNLIQDYDKIQERLRDILPPWIKV